MDDNNVTFSSADMKDLYNEVFAGSDVVKEDIKTTSELDTATEVTKKEVEFDFEDEKDEKKEVETKEDTDDLPWDDEEDEKKEEESEDPDEEELKKLELSEKWRQKRLNKELEKRKAAEEELTKLKAELETLRVPGTNEPKPKDNGPKPIYQNPKNIDEVVGNLIFQDPVIIELAKKEQYIKDHQDEFANMGEYANALISIQSDLKTEIKFKDKEIREYLKNEQTNQVTEESKIAETYEKKVESVKEQYPQVIKAKEELTKIADKLHIEIRRALVMDENSGELTWALGSSKKNMSYLLEATKTAELNGRLPIDAIKFIGRLSAEINKNKIPDDTDVRLAKEEKTLPKTIKQRPGRSTDENDPVQWAKAVREGKIKAPEWLR